VRVAFAVGVSVAAHGMFLLATPAELAPLKATPEGTAIEVFEASPLSPRRVEGRGEGVVERRKRVVRRSVEEAEEAVEAVAGEPVAVQALEPVAETDTSTSTSTPTAEPTPTAPPTSAPVFDITALHAQLAAAAQRCYPPAAKRYRLTGEATVDFCLDAAGALKSTALARSSGQDLLDGAARDCVIAGALPFPSEAAGGCYSVPVRFR